jgi:hypothetical protein
MMVRIAFGLQPDAAKQGKRSRRDGRGFAPMTVVPDQAASAQLLTFDQEIR